MDSNVVTLNLSYLRCNVFLLPKYFRMLKFGKDV